MSADDTNAHASSTSVDTVLSASALLAVLLAALSVLWALSVSSERASVGYQVGDTFTSNLVNFEDAPMTLVIWLQSTCGACVRSTDFYRRIASLRRRARVIVMSPEPNDRLQDFLRHSDINPVSAISTNGDWSRFKGTPTLLLIDRDATVRNVWYGRITSATEEDEILRVLDGLM